MMLPTRLPLCVGGFCADHVAHKQGLDQFVFSTTSGKPREGTVSPGFAGTYRAWVVQDASSKRTNAPPATQPNMQTSTCPSGKRKPLAASLGCVHMCSNRLLAALSTRRSICSRLLLTFLVIKAEQVQQPGQ